MSNTKNSFNTTFNMAVEQALEEACGRIASAAADLDDVSAIIHAAVQCAAQNPDALDGLSANQADLDAAQSAAHEYGKRLAAIADAADNAIGAYTVTAALCESPEFSAAMWRIYDGLRTAVLVLQKCGVTSVTAQYDGAEDTEVYNDYFSLKGALSSVLELLSIMACEYDCVPAALPMPDAIERTKTVHTDLLRAYSAALGMAPEELGMSETEYCVCMNVLNAAIHAAWVLEVRAQEMSETDWPEKEWDAYSKSDEALQAKTAIITALYLCPMDAF